MLVRNDSKTWDDRMLTLVKSCPPDYRNWQTPKRHFDVTLPGAVEVDAADASQKPGNRTDSCCRRRQ